MSTKISVLFTFLLCTGIATAESFDSFVTNVKEVYAYAGDTNYTYDHCVVIFKDPTPSSCANKYRGLIKTDKGIGDLMCSVAMTALVSGKKVRIGSYDDNCNYHGATVLRYIIIFDE